MTGITGFIVRWNEFEPYFTEFNMVKIVSTFIWLFGIGLIFSLVSQMGFFAYLTIHRFGLGIFKSASLWNGVQIVLILFTLFDFVYFRYKAFGQEEEGVLLYIAPAIPILLIGILVASFKARQTNQGAFIPAIFFMTVLTIIEWVPALRINDPNWVYLMLVPLLICNSYQLLILHFFIEKSNKERKAKMEKPA